METDKTKKRARLNIKEIEARHGMPVSIISNRDSRFMSRIWQSVQESLGTRPDMNTAYHPRRTVKAEVGDEHLTVPEIGQETTDKIFEVKDRLKATQDRQKSCASNRRKPLEFHIGDRTLLKVSSWEGIARVQATSKITSPSLYLCLYFTPTSSGNDDDLLRSTINPHFI
ncbi:hypothetical protein L1987_46679 [Smallanthus sonchifolius]|uniref:Uncharacterized protein n=1 Tax=Smallanthus sonchifolius TaxID=185202 RepID=A0ACB9FZU8_9ASTR|nr:hypothetical protein L1987_46679 [Smallanthus sonchifolius]